MARGSTLADHYRAHREAFALAQELGCTPREAEAELRRRRAKQRHDAAARRLAEKKCGTVSSGDQPEWNQPWMMRD